MSKASVKFVGGSLVVGLDTNEDGQNVMDLKINMQETLEEAFAAIKKGEKKEVELDVKKVVLKFGAEGMTLTVDTDQDGENSIELNVSLMEAVDEVGDLINKDKEE